MPAAVTSEFSLHGMFYTSGFRRHCVSGSKNQVQSICAGTFFLWSEVARFGSIGVATVTETCFHQVFLETCVVSGYATKQVHLSMGNHILKLFAFSKQNLLNVINKYFPKMLLFLYKVYSDTLFFLRFHDC